MRRVIPLVLAFVVLALTAPPALAADGPRRKRRKRRRPQPVEIPIDVGVGPAAHLISGPVFRDRPVHTGIALHVQAIVDKKTIRRFKHRIPARFRRQALQLEEVRLSHFLIPRTIFVSPAVGGASTGMYGLTLRPLGLSVPLAREPVRLSLDVGLVLTYAYLHSTSLPSPTHFLRPGLDPGVELEVPLAERFLVSVGWRSQLYVPQPVGGGVFELAPLDASIWHIGQAFFKFQVRFPYKIRG